jgi:hypothetical protein
MIFNPIQGKTEAWWGILILGKQRRKVWIFKLPEYRPSAWLKLFDTSKREE